MTSFSNLIDPMATFHSIATFIVIVGVGSRGSRLQLYSSVDDYFTNLLPFRHGYPLLCLPNAPIVNHFIMIEVISQP